MSSSNNRYVFKNGEVQIIYAGREVSGAGGNIHDRLIRENKNDIDYIYNNMLPYPGDGSFTSTDIAKHKETAAKKKAQEEERRKAKEDAKQKKEEENRRKAEKAEAKKKKEQKTQRTEAENEFMTENTNAGKNCMICRENQLQCLCEVVVEVKEDDKTEKYYWHSRKDDRKALPKVVFSSGTTDDTLVQAFADFIRESVEGSDEDNASDQNENNKEDDKKSDFSFQLFGECHYGRKDKCVTSTLYTYKLEDKSKEENSTNDEQGDSFNIDDNKSIKVTKDSTTIEDGDFGVEDGKVFQRLDNGIIRFEEEKGIEDEFDITYDDDLKIYGTLTKTGINPKDTELSEDDFTNLDVSDRQAIRNYLPFYQALYFFFFSELKSYPINLYQLIVHECNTEQDINNRVVIDIISAPSYRVLFNITLSHRKETYDEDFEKEYREESKTGAVGYSLNTFRTAKFGLSGSIKIEHNNREVEVEIPTIPKLETIPILNKLVKILNLMDQTKDYGKIKKTEIKKGRGNKKSKKGKNHFPIAFSIFPPQVVFSIGAELANISSSNLIERTGTLKLDPLIGFGIKIDIFECLTRLGGPIGKAVGKLVYNAFDAVKDTAASDSSSRASTLKRKAKPTGKFSWLLSAKAVGFIYLAGEITAHGEVSVVPSELFDFKLPVENPIVGGDVTLGLYAGVRIEARLIGFGASVGVGVELETGFSIEWNIAASHTILKHSGLIIRVYADAELSGKEDSNDELGYPEGGSHSTGHEKDDSLASGKLSWSGEVYPAGILLEWGTPT